MKTVAGINIFMGLLDLENYFKWSGKRRRKDL